MAKCDICGKEVRTNKKGPVYCSECVQKILGKLSGRKVGKR